MLPMQRITRLPLLVDAIFHRLESGTPEFERCRMTMATLNKVIWIFRKIELNVPWCYTLCRLFKSVTKELAKPNASMKCWWYPTNWTLPMSRPSPLCRPRVGSSNEARCSVWCGVILTLVWLSVEKSTNRPYMSFFSPTCWSSPKREGIHDLLLFFCSFANVVTNPFMAIGREDTYAVLDYCPRNMVQVDEHVRTEKPIGKPGSELSKNLILMTMLQNHENKTVEMVLFSFFFFK